MVLTLQLIESPSPLQKWLHSFRLVYHAISVLEDQNKKNRTVEEFSITIDFISFINKN